ncbi:hypothetical protein OSB04_004205 [Centaurea solstitialis]|uniref:GDSL esterase/lipase n=1 Tax=Centaurea solstitialis TaxID=347529 RepID=A0AA38TY36_9ASTR|nr:hypothetical protein OSB04_004205 [Centaurea solstitialis]
MSSSTTTIVAVAITTVFLLLTTSSAGPASRPFKKIYAFGDSYTDTRKHCFRGIALFTLLASLPQPQSDTKSGVNYAVAGSTAIPYGFFVKNNLTLDIQPQTLQTQLAWFSKTLEGQKCKNIKSTPNECKAVFKDALIWVGEIGANDYAYTVGSSALLNKGAKYVVVEGLPTTGCLTLSMALASESDRDDMGCVGSLNKQSYDHNTVLLTKIQELRRKYPQTVIVYADYWNAYRSVIKNAPRLGFKEPYKVCCGSAGSPYNFDVLATCGSQSSTSCQDPGQYINWDGVHLTEAMNKVVYESFIKGGFTHPPFGMC